MKKAAFVLFISGILLSCHKANTDKPVPNPDNSIFGEWRYTEYYISPGTIVDWEKVDNGSTLAINRDSTYKISRSQKPEAYWPFTAMGLQGKLGVTAQTSWGSNATYFIKQGTADSIFFYPIRVNKDTLELAGFCFEGCIYRFRKIR